MIEIRTIPRSFAFCKALLTVCLEQNSISAIVSCECHLRNTYRRFCAGTAHRQSILPLTYLFVVSLMACCPKSFPTANDVNILKEIKILRISESNTCCSLFLCLWQMFLLLGESILHISV